MKGYISAVGSGVSPETCLPTTEPAFASMERQRVSPEQNVKNVPALDIPIGWDTLKYKAD